MTESSPAAGGERELGGSVWRRWEPHIHTPGTALSDGYGSVGLDTFLSAVEQAQPSIECLGVTDYLLLECYEKVLEAKRSGRLPNVALLFCNIEMRLSIETRAGKGVNLHVLISPDDPAHVERARTYLSSLSFRYARDTFNCTVSDLIRLGKAHDPNVQDDDAALKIGVNQFKVDFGQLRQLYDESAWLQQNTLIAVAGSSNDGTAGLQDETASFAAQRREIEAFAHIIFTATPASISFWRGEGVLSIGDLDAKYGGLKPCLHGSDAHTLDKVAKPDHDRYTWIKGDPTFEALVQACMEPRLRVHIGDAPPVTNAAYSVASTQTAGLSWLLPNAQRINCGMVAIIGARGSGKTALADLIAHSADSPFPTASEQSFVVRAQSLLKDSKVSSQWSDGTQRERSLSRPPVDLPDVHYLTQQFVERLCSSVAESDELLAEIKRVVFQAHKPEDRLGADNFDALVELRSTETDLAVLALGERLDRLSQDILTERSWYIKRPGLQQELLRVKDEAARADAARKSLVKPGGADRASYYSRLSAAITNREQQLQGLERQSQGLRRLSVEVERTKTDVFPRLLSDLKRSVGEGLVAEEEWAPFVIQFAGDPQPVITMKAAAITNAGHAARAIGSGVSPGQALTVEQLGSCSLEALQRERALVEEQVGADRKNLQRLEQLNQLVATKESQRRRVEEDLARADQSPARLQGILSERAALYERFFELITEKATLLAELYRPLELQLGAATSSANKLHLRVNRRIDVDAWARRGEELLDLRKNGDFRGRGILAGVAKTELLPAWQSGTAAEVSIAMEEFRKRYDHSLLQQSGVEVGSDEYHQWVIDLGRWLYSTDHVQVHYTIDYEGVAITQLSPGTRGIVLLLLYLALDTEDARPLIIDQPEENLDPRSVFAELVELFREARQRRQVIIVTHNANLVVNTDVDQVIVATCTRRENGAPPEFHYASGGLENPQIRLQVCDILEGGEAAFRERAKRLRVNLRV